MMSTDTGKHEEMLDRILLLLTTFEGVQAVGLSGSRAEGTADEWSGTDVFIYSAKVPPGDVRLRQYRDAGVGEVRSFDVDLELHRVDLLRVDDRMVSLGWAAVPEVERCLHSLARDYDSNESLPGWLLATKPLYDPGKVLERLKREVPAYPRERSIHRVRRVLQAARLEFHDRRRLEAAVLREDAYLFFVVQHELLDAFFKGLFALNGVWCSEETQMVERAAALAMRPQDIDGRLRSVLLRTNASSDLAGAYDALQSLFADLTSLAQKELTDAALPPN